MPRKVIIVVLTLMTIFAATVCVISPNSVVLERSWANADRRFEFWIECGEIGGRRTIDIPKPAWVSPFPNHLWDVPNTKQVVQTETRTIRDWRLCGARLFTQIRHDAPPQRTRRFTEVHLSFATIAILLGLYPFVALVRGPLPRFLRRILRPRKG